MRTLLINEFTVERKLPVNFKKEDLSLFQHELKKTFAPVYLTTLRNAYVLNDIVYSGFQFYIPQSLSYPMYWKEQLKRVSYFLKPGPTYDKCIWITDDWAYGYFHWISDALPRLIACRDKINGHKVLLHEKCKSIDYVLRSLELLGFEYVFYSDKCKVKELLLPDHVSVSGNYYPPDFQLIRNGLLKSRPAITPHRKIYVSRKLARFRRLINEDEFISLLEKYDFEIHYFENYSLEEQMQLMQETKYFIGVHGAALTNICFIQENTRILELRFSDDLLNNCYFALANVCRVDYYYQVCNGTSGDTHIADMTIDIAASARVLEQFLSV